jgi:DNA-binding XRE family transcriptional regulator
MTQRALTRSVDQFHEAVLVGRRIRWLREQCGLSRAAVAAYAGVSERTLARVESGDREGDRQLDHDPHRDQTQGGPASTDGRARTVRGRTAVGGGRMTWREALNQVEDNDLEALYTPQADLDMGAASRAAIAARVMWEVATTFLDVARHLDEEVEEPGWTVQEYEGAAEDAVLIARWVEGAAHIAYTAEEVAS